MSNGVHRVLDNAHPSSGSYFIQPRKPYFSCDGLLYVFLFDFHPFVFKWLNLNNFSSLCDCHSPIKVKWSSVLINTGCFPTRLYHRLYYHTRVKLIFLKFMWSFVPYFWEWVNQSLIAWVRMSKWLGELDWGIWEIELNVTGWVHLRRRVTSNSNHNYE